MLYLNEVACIISIMTSSNNGQYGPNLQSTVPENRTVMSPVFTAPNRVQAVAPSISGINPTQNMSSTTVPPTLTLPTIPSQQPAINNVVKTTTIPVVPMTADDGDLIEKEWVNKAKKIVESFREDPHRQSKELTLFKADYMQKRYNKTIKLGE